MFTQALSQPVLTGREVRQTGECCPCPDTSNVGKDSVGASSARAESRMEHCPCWPRGADSEGASSLFFPTAVRASGTHMRPSDTKEDTKNLLKPEVTLATSMLDTLREATEEEYQDALARDAARDADPSDAIPEESGNVVMIVHPRKAKSDEDFLPEASHVQESRCIHPIGKFAKLRSSEPVNSSPETIIRFPISKHPGLIHTKLNTDSSLGASDIRESVIEVDGNTPRFEHKPFSHLNTPIKNILNNGNENDIFRKSPFSGLGYMADGIENRKFPHIPLPKLDGLLRNQFEEKNLNINDRSELNNKHKLSEAANDGSPIFRQTNSPFNLKDFLKLRDVELIPKLKRNKSLNDLIKPTVLHSRQTDDTNADNLSGPLLKTAEHKDKSTGRDSEGSDSKLDVNECVVKQELPQVQQDADNLDSSLDQFRIGNNGGRSEYSRRLIDSPRENELVSNSAESQELAQDKTLLESEGNSLKYDDLNTKRDSDTAGNNIISSTLQFESQETMDDTASALQNKKNNNDVKDFSSDQSIESCNTAEDTESTEQDKNSMDSKVSQVMLSPPFGKSLSDMHENLIKGITNLRKPFINVELPKAPMDQKTIRYETPKQIENSNNDAVNEGANSLDFIPVIQSHETKQLPSDMSFDDLQVMSDTLLLSNDNQSETDDINCSISNEDDRNPETKSNDDSIKLSKDEKEISSAPNDTEEHITENKNAKQAEDIYCIDNMKHTSSMEIIAKSANQENENLEMDTGASDTVITKIFDPLNNNLKVLQDISKQPLIKDPLKLLDKPLHDTLDTNLPTLDNVKERIANVFNNRNTEKSMFTIQNNGDDNSSIEPMTPAASITNSRQKLPSLKPLDDFSVDIFRPKLPNFTDSMKKLNLNPNKKKTGPSNKELVPRNLASTLGSEKNTLARKSKPIDLLSNHLETLPSLDDLSNTVRSNTKNLLSKSVNPDLDLFTENLRSANVDDITENIRQNTQKTMKDLERKMKSALRNTKTSSTLADKYAKPEELLDDVNDKLKAIHYDLNERLTSFRESILDSTRLRNLENERKSSNNRNVLPNSPNKARKTPARLQTSASTLTPQKIEPLIEDRVPNNFWQLPLRRQSAETIPPTIGSMAKIANPTLSQLKEPFLRQNPPSIPKRPLITTLSKPSQESLDKMPTFTTKKAVIPLQDHRRKSNKVTISFGTTTPMPILSARSRVPTISTHSNEQSSTFPNKSMKERFSVNDKLGSAGPKFMPNEFNSFKTPAPLMLADEDENFDDDSSNENIMSNSDLQRTIHRGRYKPQNKYNAPEAKYFDRSAETLNKFSRMPSKSPKATENSFLSKVMNAFNTDPDINEDKSLESRPDMFRSESRYADAAGGETLKEKVSYRCKMICYS